MKQYFGNVPRRPMPPPVVNAEPPQRGERRIAFHRPAELPAVLIGYKIGSFKDPDDPALDVLVTILSHGESSRLYRKLVYEKQVASEVWAFNESRLDPGLFTIYAQARPGHTAAECEQAIYEVLEEIRKEGVNEREVRKAKNILRVGFVGRFKSNVGRAGLLADYEALWGDWRQLYQYLPQREKVTAEDVRRVVGKYFSDQSRTVVTLFPEKL
jgi:predicted Zn-dependent peptidase